MQRFLESEESACEISNNAGIHNKYVGKCFSSLVNPHMIVESESMWSVNG